jgi:putative tryptophan/tyrosine transport system substrate-binding protein
VRRREFIALGCGSLLIFPAALRARPSAAHTPAHLGVLGPTDDANELEAGLRASLQQLGYVEGRTIQLEYRRAQGHFDRLPALAAELVQLNPDVIIAVFTPGTLAAAAATHTRKVIRSSGMAQS